MPSPARVSRRTALGASTAALLLCGCDIDPPQDPSAPPGSPAALPEDHDLVARTAALLGGAAALATTGATRFPELADALSPLAAAHSAHHALLGRAVAGEDEATTPPPLPGRSRRALRRVLDNERAVLREVEQACLSAASGDLARVLASIAASTSQHVATLQARVAP